MRTITSKYSGECRKCGASLQPGDTIAYHRPAGTFCPGCAPADPDELRGYMAGSAEAKAQRLEGWADKRISNAEAGYKRDEHLRDDWAFITQPGHIPERERWIKREQRRIESVQKARAMQARAEGLRRNVRVAGDAERVYRSADEKALSWVQVGMRVKTPIAGIGIVIKVNKRTVTLCTERGFVSKEPLHWLTPVDPEGSPLLPVPPLCNFPMEGAEHLTTAEWRKVCNDFRGERYSPSTETQGGFRYRSKLGRGCGIVPVYLTDAKRVDPPIGSA